MRPLRPGDPTEIGSYQVRAHLGGGGMGTVYLATTPGGRLVAVKVIRPELTADEEFLERFRLEIRAARRVRGLYTAELLDADPDDRPPWLVTAYVPGPSLAQAVKAQGPVPHELVPLLMAGVAEALLDIHAAGIVHRDLKPPNVLLSPDGPRVIDFGIAKALDAARVTQTGITMGSPECMTPEQIRGLPITQAADVFTLGSLGAYAASGRPAFDAPNSAARMYRIINEDPVLDGIPAELRQLLEQCFVKDADDRPSTTAVLEMCRALIPRSSAVFPRSWRTDAYGETQELSWPGQLVPAGDTRPADGQQQAADGAAASDDGAAAPDDGWSSPAKGWVTGPDPDLAAAPPAPETVPPKPAPEAPRGQPATPARLPRPPAAVWLAMCGAAALAITALVVGLVTLPSLRATLGRQYAGSPQGAVSEAVNLAVVVLVACALTGAGTWLWAALDTARGNRRARTVARVALAVSTLGLASNLLGLSTTALQGLALAGWLAGLAAVLAGWPGRNRRRDVADAAAGPLKGPARPTRMDP